MPAKTKVIVGREYGRLTVKVKLPGQPLKFRCRCRCGKWRDVLGYLLSREECQSCGCYRRENSRRMLVTITATHRLTGTLTWLRWQGLKRRLKNNVRYVGMEIHPAWIGSYETFLADMGECPGQDFTIERKDNAIGYVPHNCRWATKKEQAFNRSSTWRVSDDNGVEMAACDYAAKYGLGYDGLLKHLRRGRSASEARVIMRRRL